MNTAMAKQVNWRQVGLFLGLTFAISWAIDLLLFLTVGYGANQATGILLQLQMLIPAAVAIGLGLFLFSDSLIYFRNDLGRVRWFLYYFLFFTLIYFGLGILAAAQAIDDQSIAIVSLAINMVSLILLVVLRLLRGGKESFARAGLAFGHPKYWLGFGVILFLLYLSQTGLNALFGLGQAADLDLIALSANMPPILFFIIAGIQSIILGPFLGLLFGFGEEYGWRGFLQSQMIRMGKKRGILLIGIIWGIWHWPIIWMGHNYPGEPVLGSLLMVVYTILLAFFLGYAVLKSGSVWLAAFLHAVNNQVYSFLVGLVYTPDSMILSFGSGVFGLALGALLVLLLLRDPVWRDELVVEPEARVETVSGV